MHVCEDVCMLGLGWGRLDYVQIKVRVYNDRKVLTVGGYIIV